MDNLAEKYNYKGHEIQILFDNDSESPRDWDNIGTMVCFHNRYSLGDKHDLSKEMFNGWEELRRHLIKEERAVVILPLYLYDHSGITMNTTGFSCPWDSGQVGYIYATREDILKNVSCGGKRLTKALKDKAKEILEAEVKTYNQYLTGDVYGFIVDKDTDYEDSCWGFYGIEDLKKEVEHSVDIFESEVELAKNTPEDDLPLLLDRKWGNSKAEETYKERFKGSK